MYYKVKAYCGHAGAGKSQLLVFAIEAETITEAIELTRKMPMVKHTHPMAIMSAEMIDKKEYDLLMSRGAYRDLWG